MTKETFLADKYRITLEALNVEISKLQVTQSMEHTYSALYRSALTKEAELLQVKLDLINEYSGKIAEALAEERDEMADRVTNQVNEEVKKYLTEKKEIHLASIDDMFIEVYKNLQISEGDIQKENTRIIKLREYWSEFYDKQLESIVK